jgi:hypothetical protein
MNKLLVVSKETHGRGDNLWIILRGVDQIVQRHAKDIDVELLENVQKAKLDDLGEKDILYVAGHGSVGNIEGRSAAYVWEALKDRLPSKKSSTIKFLACNTGNYLSKKRGTTTEKVPVNGIFAKELKELFRKGGHPGLKLQFPINSAVVLGAKVDDGVLNPEAGIPKEEAVKLKGFTPKFVEDWVETKDPFDAAFVQEALFLANDRYHQADEKAIKLVFTDKRPLKEAAAQIAAEASVKSFFEVYNALVIKYKLCHPTAKGWFTLTT